MLALAETREEADSIWSKLSSQGGASLTTHREQWWRDLREHERAAYEGNFEDDEEDYGRGFETAIEPANRGKRLGESADVSNPDRKGYERGYQYISELS